MWLGSTMSLQKGMESRRIVRTRTARMEMRQVEPGVEKHKARWHAPADARCWSSAGTARGLVLLRMRPDDGDDLRTHVGS